MLAMLTITDLHAVPDVVPGKFKPLMRVWAFMQSSAVAGTMHAAACVSVTVNVA